MFVVVTLLAAFIAYHVNWIRQRQGFLREENAARTAKAWDIFFVPYPNNGHVGSVEAAAAPGLLRIFGEQGVVTVYFVLDGDPNEAFTARDVKRWNEAHRLFPEAQIGGEHRHGRLLLYGTDGWLE